MRSPRARSVSISRLWRITAEHGSRLSVENSTPHISLAVFTNAFHEVLDRRIKAIARKTPTFSLEFSTLGCFPATSDVIFIAPNPTRELLELPATVISRFQDIQSREKGHLHDYFRLNHWFPHVTIATGLSGGATRHNAFQAATFMVFKVFKPFEARAVALSTLDFSKGKKISQHHVFELL